MTRFSTLLELLDERAAAKLDQRLYTFLGDSEGDESTALTYGELHQRARRIAAALQGMAAPGERVMLLYPPGLEYIAGFFGCLYAGMIAVPAYPPDPARLDRTLPRLKAIIQDARATVVLTTSFILSMGEFLFEHSPDLKTLRWIATDDVPAGVEDAWRRPEVGAATLAFLQYTSGSTGTPKGVMLTHGNLQHNLELIAHAFRAHSGSTGVIWLPPYHDMGLIGGILEPLYGAFPVTLMSPLSFLRQPFRWLEAISRAKATISGGPNFAYDLCVRKSSPEQRRTLDLSSWELAFSGAEPVRPETLDRFTEAFGPCGFRRESFYPCYGLAEAVLIVSGGNAAEAPILHTVDAKALEQNRTVAVPPGQSGARTLVGAGRSLLDQEIAIVHPETLSRCSPGAVGEVWVRGPSVAQGYWQKSEETERVFQARAADGEAGPFLRTGDLGFLKDGELFVTGRLKDLIIIRGRNHYPQDLELTAEQSHPTLRPGCAAAFSVDVEAEERLVLVLEIDVRKEGDLRQRLERCEAAVGAIRQRLAEAHEVQPYAVVLIEPGSIPKTSSGKIQRYACRNAFHEDGLKVVLAWRETDALAERSVPEPPPTSLPTPAETVPGELSTVEDVQAWLVARLAAHLRVKLSAVEVGEPVTRLGLDSLAAVELAHEIETGLGVPLPMEALLQGPSPAQLARQLFARRAERGFRPSAQLQRGERQGPLPLSFAQQRLWFLDQLEPGSPFYNIPAAVRLRGALDAAALERCFNEIVKRHESLRTTFQAGGDGPLQVISSPAPLQLVVVDLAGLPEAARQADVHRLAEEEARRPFALLRGPLLRTLLLRLGEQEHVLLLTMHHIVSDGWSMGVLVREMGALYPAFSTGRPSPLPDLSIQYADYAGWQKERLRGDSLDAQLVYWRRQLEGAPPVLELPTDRPRPPVQSFKGANETLLLPRTLSEQLQAMARKEGCTPFMVLLAAFQTLLHRYTGQTDIVVGTDISNRNHPGIQGLIGFFVNQLVMRCNLSGDPGFRELLGRTREVALEAYAHQELPFEELVKLLNPERSLGHAPIFQVKLTFQDASVFALELPGLSLDATSLNTGATKFDLTLSVTDTAKGLSLLAEYSTDLFEPDTMTRFLGHLRTLLEGAVAAPERRLSALPLLTGPERQQLLVDWNDTAAPTLLDRCAHPLFEARAVAAPDAPAVSFQDQHLTFRELDSRANQLAHYLRTLGVGPDVLVGLCVTRSLEMVVGALGILKAGGAYVPLDPSYPVERLGFMLRESAVPVLVTLDALADELPSTGEQLVCLDSEWPQIARHPEQAPSSSVTPDNLAYAIFTSGSTGTPKGTLLTHRGLCNTARAAADAMGLKQGSRVLQFAAFGFDASVWEMFSTLLSGGELCLATREALMPGEPLQSLMQQQAITAATLTPSALSQLDPEGLPKLETVVSAGEACTPELAARWSQGHRFINAYGPTEVTVCATLDGQVDTARPSIGRALTNVRVYVLDENGEPVPIGVPGELYVGGIGLARGYLRRPELTAERFVPDPFSSTPGARLYRTGDLVRYLPDGRLEFLGRLDSQVKVRGFRIELGEVEAVLAQHPEVREAAVLVREDVPGNKRLVAYVVGASAPPESAALRDFLKERLPEYMVPSAFMALESLPLTPNGKVDRKALPAPEVRPEDASFIAPRTPTEEVLASIWGQLLSVEKVGAQDDFFALGGHSLLATQLASRIRSTFQVEVPLRELFSAITLAAQAERVDAAVRDSHGLAAPPLVPHPRTGRLLLSFAQRRLWFLDQLEPDSPFYNIAGAVRLEGTLDVEALERSFDAIVERHESLRTTFRAEAGEPFQVIAAPSALSLSTMDLRHLTASAQEAEVQRLATEEGQRPFKLAAGPLLRAALLRLSDAQHVLLLTMHHIVSDGWSMDVLIREVAAFYAAFSAGASPTLPPLPIQYADFAHWQSQWLEGGVLEAQLKYWKGQLAGISPLDLPTDHPRPAVRSQRGGFHSFPLPGALVSALEQVTAREQGATLFMTLLATFKVLLSRYSGQGDICVGMPIANRTRAELEPLIGFFVNTLVLRTDLSDDPEFALLLERVKETALGAYAHQDLPFERLVEALEVKRDPSRPPLFQALFGLQNTPLRDLALPGLQVEMLPIQTATAKFDLTLWLREQQGGLVGELEYSTDLFEAGTVERMMAHFRTLLEGVASGARRRIGELPLLSETERSRLLREWTATSAEFPREACIHALFEAQVERTPDAVALEFNDTRLTYRQLEESANRLAHFLQYKGVALDEVVALCMERSPEMVVGILGVLKAGGAWLPLDPSFPRERLAFMLEDSGARLLLTQERLTASLPPSNAQKVFLDSGWAEISRYGSGRPDSRVMAENLAYVIYTSGSTGRPKGSPLAHRGLCNNILAGIKALRIQPDSCVLQFVTFGFDISIWDTFLALVSGARLCLVPREVLPGQPLKDLIREKGVTAMTLTPSALMQFDPEGLTQLETVVSGGDAVTPELVRRWKPGRRVLNAYGPTETTICCTLNLDMDVERPTIGRSLPNMRAYVLDPRMEPLPAGVPGELYIGGVGLSRGYLRRPELTAERFIPDPFASEPGERVYRTGDRARYLSNGELEFLGRIDQQVKVRGFRIELGEIEAALAGYPAVREAVVVVREDVPGDKRLVAYAVPQPGESLEGVALRQHLGRTLPEYMVPSAFVALDALPLMPNGKVDRKALPAPDGLRLELGNTFVAPRTPIEEALAGTWARLLNVERVGVHDSFFELGGHSLLATQAISRVRESFGVELPLRDLFTAPTVAGLAERVEAAIRAGQQHQAPPLTPRPRTGPLPLSFAQQRLWFLDQLEPGLPAYNIPVAFRLEGELEEAALERSLGELVRRHEVLRTTFQAREEEPVQVISPPTALRFGAVDLRELPGDARSAEALRLASEEAWRPFELARGPLLRATLLRLGEREHILLLTMHHIISDGWSMGVVVREMAALYGAFVSGRPSPLAELSIQYADYAAWQRGWLRGEVLATELAWWRGQLEGAPALLELLTDRPRPPVQTFHGASRPLLLPRALSEGLQALCQREGVTPFMALLAAFQVLLHRYSGQDDISVGSPIAGRNRAELEGLIGFFVNTLVLRTRLSGDLTFRALLAQVRETTLGAYAHQDVPFEKLVGELQPVRSLSHSPLFQVMFIVQNAPVSELRLPELSFRPVETAITTAKFDLTLNLGEHEGAWVGELNYNTDLFDDATAERMRGHLGALLEGAFGDPEQRLVELPLLTGSERHQLLVEWNRTEAEYPEDACLHALFEAQARRTPDATAVIGGAERLTYRELNLRANRLAHYLRALGVRPEDRVGLCVERTPELLVEVLAILKAGGAYVPLDPAYPSQRLAFMLRDSGARVLLTREHLAASLPADGLAVVLCGAPLEGHEENPAPAAAPGNLAYLIYTSGSTGTPKGVAIEHRSAVAFLEWTRQVFSQEELRGVLASTSICFDLSVFELFAPLSRGGTVVLADNALHLPELPAAGEVTLLNTVPSALAQLLRMGAVPPSVRTINLAGEALPAPLVEQAYAVGTVDRLLNLYGPSEDTTYSTFAVMAREGGGTPPIGRPIANTRAYVLDQTLRPVPVGVAGELFLAGAGLARGYLARPELTAERFLPDPHGEAGVRMYRTGDLARFRADGVLDFLGRRDHQVKLRGFRIELGEVEAALVRHPALREATVVVREVAAGDARLLAYVVFRPEQQPDTGLLRAFLQQRLPEYMVPSGFVVLEALPLSPNGKVDRKALPAPSSERPEGGRSFVAPRDALELQLARIWEELLGLERVGVCDDFFALGGHSLLAVRLMARIRQSTGTGLPLSALFQGATVEHLASLLRRATGTEPWSPLVRISGSGDRTPFFCVHPVGGNVLCYAELARLLGPEQPFYGLQARGLEEGQEPLGSIEEMAALYVEAIRSVQPAGPYLLGGWSLGGTVAFEMARQLDARGQRVAVLALIDSHVGAGAPELAGQQAASQVTAMFIGDLLGASGAGLSIPEEMLGRGDPDELLRHVLEQGRKAGAIGPDAELSQLQALRRVFESNLRASGSYVPRLYAGPVILFQAGESHVGASRPERGWASVAARLDVREIPGDHYSLLRAPQVQALAGWLKQALAEAPAAEAERAETA